jgi:Leucine-rich repeat (LRR) protein
MTIPQVASDLRGAVGSCIAARPLALRPPARHADGMAKPLAKLLSMLTPKRRWAQFSLATMFVVVTVLCVSLSVVVNRANRQQDAVAAIEALGGRVEYAEPDQETSAAFPRQFLRRWLPRDYFDEVREVDLNGTQVTDAGLAHLQGLTALQELYLRGTQVTDAGLAHLRGLTGLLSLNLNDTQVTDAGLAHLQGLSGLGTLSLSGTQVTDAGLAHLQGLTGLQELSLRLTQVTDAGLEHLQGLTGLEILILNGTQVTDAGLGQFRQALPNCAIYGR